MWEPLIICNNPPDFPEPCQFSHLIVLVQNVISNLIVFSTFLATAAFIYAGFLLLTSGVREENRKKAGDIFRKVLIGYLWILGAWILVYTITSVLIDTTKFPSFLGQP